ncbi:hypothetical protein BLOT_015676 [Blomia tropicalis]|nr:hypothetical protein BLOT_015676 [Blomia tropicalis]
MKRHDFTIRRKTTISQKDPNDLCQKIARFILYVRKVRTEESYKLSDIINCDETPIQIETVGSTTIDKIGSKEINLLSTGHEKQSCVVMLTAKADGTKLKPYVTFKRKRKLLDLEKKFPQVVIGYSSNGWFDESITQDYLNKVISTFSFSKRLLIWDVFKCHTMDRIKEKLERMKIIPIYIPAGCTKYLQPADVSWNKPFKDYYSEYYNEWMRTASPNLTKHGNPRPPPKEKILSWIIGAWNKISPELIQKSFKACGISNEVNGSEDDLIHCSKHDHLKSVTDLLSKNSEETVTTSIEINEEDDDDDDYTQFVKELEKNLNINESESD